MEAAIVCLPHSSEHVGRCPFSKRSVAGEFILGSQKRLPPLFPTVGHTSIVSAHPCNLHTSQMGNCLVPHIAPWETFPLLPSLIMWCMPHRYHVSDIKCSSESLWIYPGNLTPIYREDVFLVVNGAVTYHLQRTLLQPFILELHTACIERENPF